MTVRGRARDVKGGSRVKVPSRAGVGASPAGRRRGGRGTIGLGRPPRGTPATRSVGRRAGDVEGPSRAEVLSRAAELATIGAGPAFAGRAGDIESVRAWVLSRAEPVGNGASVLVPPPRGTPATGSVGLTVPRRTRGVKGGSRAKVRRAKVLSRIASPATIGARPLAG